MIHSLRARILIGTVLLVFAGFLVVGFATYAALDSFLVARVDSQLKAAAMPAAEQLQPHGRGGFQGGPQGSATGLPSGTYVALYSSSGTLVQERALDPSSSATVAKPSLPAPLPNAGNDVPTLLTAAGSRVLVESLDAYGGDFIVIAEPLEPVQSTVTQLLLLEAGISTLVLVGIAILALLVVRQGLRPLERMADTATAIAAGDLTQRVAPATAVTEIGRLGLALNVMLDRIEQAFAERERSENRLRRFVGDASHELRTPLTSIRGYAELLRRRPDLAAPDSEAARRRIEDEAIRMSALVDDLLLLARLDQGRPLEHEDVDLLQIARDACADVSVTDPQRTVALDATLPVIVNGDELRLRQVVANLVRNAVVHTPPGTPVEVRLESAEGLARLYVVDHGPGLEEAERERVFEPFYRADPSRSRDRGGSGLGLSIVAAVVMAHGGRVSAHPTPGGGATFEVDLPVEAPPATIS